MMEAMTRFSKINILLNAATPTAQEIIVQCDARIIYNFTITPYLTIGAMTMGTAGCRCRASCERVLLHLFSGFCIHEMMVPVKIFSQFPVGNYEMIFQLRFSILIERFFLLIKHSE